MTSPRDNQIMHDMSHLAQDVDDPIWPSEPVEPAVGPAFGHAHDGLRTIHGMVDLLHFVGEEIDEWISRDTQEGPGHRPPRKREKPYLVDVFARPAKSWRGSTINVGNVASGPTLIAEPRNDRVRVVVTNWGPGILYLAHATGTALSEPQMNTIQVPPPGPDATITGRQNWREFRTQAGIYGFAAVPGTQQLVDVQDEYGIAEL